MVRDGVVVDGEGNVDEQATTILRELREKNANLADVIAQKEAAIKRLRGDQSRSLQADPNFSLAEEVLLYWQECASPTAREPLSDQRVRFTLARLKHYTVADLKKCIDGYVAFPYRGDYGRRMTHGRPEQHKVDVADMFRDARRVDDGMAMAERAGVHQEAFEPRSNGLSELGTRALDLATRLGWHVFPCKANAKQPATLHGLLDAKVEPDPIRDCWTRHPDLNIGVRTGAVSGIVVLDVDGDEGNESLNRLQQVHGKLPTTLSVVTPRGGQHFYFAHPGDQVKNTVCIPGPGLDVRGDGGYVLVPPSRVDGRSYEVDERTHPAPMPTWLLKAITDEQARLAGKIVRGEYAEVMRECVHQGMRNDRLTRIVGHMIGPRRLPPDEALAHALNMNQSNFKPPLPDREVEAVVSSIAGREIRKPLRRD